MKYWNFTPHDLNIQDNEGIMHFIPRHQVGEGEFLVLRAGTKKESIQKNGFTITRTEFMEPEWAVCGPKGEFIRPMSDEEFPQKQINVVEDKLVGSLIALQSIQKFLPDMAQFWVAPGEAIRNEQGQIVGSKGFSTL